ncbi:EthD family reductase [Amycolatopsis benzoatilytica]|uniref:EthD family reductase n=1 Tax=Amycolatopsis benzoatilytica TaxID=346045 RepID=UPI000378BF30|nr:EthD family reductase [Amycolatopsis benzoatilytica]
MHILTVAYGRPRDPEEFDRHYARIHRPLAEKLPGLEEFVTRHCSAIDGSQPPYYLIAELSFPSKASLDTALSLLEGQAAAADLENFAAGGVTMFAQYD